MKAIRADRCGGPDVLALVETDRPTAGPGEVLIGVRAIGVNYADIICREGQHPGMPQPPIVPGCEASGVVEACGAGVTRHRPGNRVAIYSPPGGTYAEWVVGPEHRVLPMPVAMSFEDAAAFTHTFLTAYHALHTLGRARAGEWAVVTAAAGGVGTAIVQMARVAGLRTIGAVGSAGKLDVLAELGVEHRVDYGSASLSRAVLEATGGRGAALVLDSVGGDVFKEAMASLAPLGRLVLYGIAGRQPVAVHPFDLLPKCATFSALNLSVIFARASELIDSSWSELVRLYESGAIRPVITRRFRLEDAAEAHRAMESRGTTGKLLLRV